MRTIRDHPRSPGSSSLQPRNPFVDLPAELLNVIFEFLVEDESPIPITHLTRSKRRSGKKSRSVPANAKTNFLRLSILNRKLHEQVNSTFFASNTFVVGTSAHVSTTLACEKGFRSFITRVPSHWIAHIRYVRFDITFGGIVSPYSEHDRFIICSWQHKANIEYARKALIKYFTGICEMHIRDCPLENGPSSDGQAMTEIDSLKVLRATLWSLLQHFGKQRVRYKAAAMHEIWGHWGDRINRNPNSRQDATHLREVFERVLGELEEIDMAYNAESEHESVEDEERRQSQKMKSNKVGGHKRKRATGTGRKRVKKRRVN